MTDLTAVIRAAYRRLDPWDAGLVGRLAAVGWADLADAGIDPAAYSTTRALERDWRAPRRLLAIVASGDLAGVALNVESLADAIPQRYVETGLVERCLSEDRIAGALRSAIDLLAKAPNSVA